jgi:hypothetical protein
VHGFLDTVRDGHPTAPLIVVGPLLWPIYEDTPGPGVPDFADGTVRFRAVGDPAEVTDAPVGKLSLRAVRAELARIVADRSPELKRWSPPVAVSPRSAPCWARPSSVPSY